MRQPVETVTTDQLITDFKRVVADAEALLKATAHQGGDEIAAIRAKAEESLRLVKSRIAEEQRALMAKSREAAANADAYVHENPWLAVAVAAGIGLVIGLLSGRR